MKSSSSNVSYFLPILASSDLDYLELVVGFYFLSYVFLLLLFFLLIATHCSGHEAGRALSHDRRRRTSARASVRSTSPLTILLLLLFLLFLLFTFALLISFDCLL